MQTRIVIIIDDGQGVGSVSQVDWKMDKLRPVLENIENMHSEVNVIMMDLGDESNAIEAHHRHTVDYLKKPVNMEMLLQKVQEKVQEVLTRKDGIIEALEEWVETHPEEANQPQRATLTKTGEMQVWSAKQVLEEIKKNTPFGRKEYKNLIKLTTDLLTRGKLKSDG